MSITIWINNTETITKATVEKDRMNVSEIMTPKYDLEKLLWDVQSLIPMKLIFKWVKSHQDKTKEGKKIYGPFQREIQFNCEMDSLASRGLNLQPNQREIYSHTVAGIYDKTEILATNLATYLYNHINGPKTREYIATKFDWDEESFQNIDWDTIGKVMKNYLQYQKTEQYNLCTTGKMSGDRNKNLTNPKEHAQAAMKLSHIFTI